MLQISDGAVVIEDRQNVAYVVPACYATQVSAVLSSSIGPNNSSFTATWTRCVLRAKPQVTQCLSLPDILTADVLAARLAAPSPSRAP